MANYGISIGINHYTPPSQMGLKTLNGAINDATSVHNWMITHGNVPEANARLITSVANPLVPNKGIVDTTIVNIIQKVLADGGAADRLYFYFAGHGLGVETDLNDNAMCMADWSELMRNASLSSSSYKQKFTNEGLFNEVVMWMDCCRNTKLNIVPGTHAGLTRLGAINNPKWFVALATQYESQAFESTTVAGETRGIFTQVLLEGLQGAAAQNGNPINADDLRDYIWFEVPGRAQAAGYLQRPDISHNTSRHDPLIF